MSQWDPHGTGEVPCANSLNGPDPCLPLADGRRQDVPRGVAVRHGGGAHLPPTRRHPQLHGAQDALSGVTSPAQTQADRRPGRLDARRQGKGRCPDVCQWSMQCGIVTRDRGKYLGLGACSSSSRYLYLLKDPGSAFWRRSSKNAVWKLLGLAGGFWRHWNGPSSGGGSEFS